MEKLDKITLTRTVAADEDVEIFHLKIFQRADRLEALDGDGIQSWHV